MESQKPDKQRLRDSESLYKDNGEMNLLAPVSVGTYEYYAVVSEGVNYLPVTKENAIKLGEFTILPISLEQYEGSIGLTGTEFFCTGKPICPKLESNNSLSLVEGRDYTITYENNVFPSEEGAKATVTGINNCTGSLKVGFTIDYVYPDEIYINGESWATNYFSGDVTMEAPGFKIADSLNGPYTDSYIIPFDVNGYQGKLYFQDEDGYLFILEDTKIEFDNTAPKGAISIGKQKFDALASEFTFENMYNQNTEMNFTAEQKADGAFVFNPTYCLVKNPSTEYTDKQLDGTDEIEGLPLGEGLTFTDSEGITLSEEGKYEVYLFIVDEANNYSYISTGGIIIDKTNPALNSFTFNNETASGVDVTVSGTDELAGMGTYYLYYSNTETTPDKDTIIKNGVSSTTGKFSLKNLTETTTTNTTQQTTTNLTDSPVALTTTVPEVKAEIPSGASIEEVVTIITTEVASTFTTALESSGIDVSSMVDDKGSIDLTKLAENTEAMEKLSTLEQPIDVVVNMNGASALSADVISLISGKNINLTMQITDGVSWTINGNSVTGQNFADIDLGVTKDTNTIPDNLVKQVSGDNYSTQISSITMRKQAS